MQKVATYKKAEGLGYPVGGGPYAYLDFHADWVGYGTRQSAKLKPLGKAAVYAVEATKGVVPVKDIGKFIEANSSMKSVSMLQLQKELKVAVALGLLSRRAGGYVLGRR